MTWNYRVVRTTYNDNDYDEVSYQIKEAYYNKAGGIWAVTENGASIYGESVEEAKEVLKKMQLVFEKEVLDLDGFVFAKADFAEEEEKE